MGANSPEIQGTLHTINNETGKNFAIKHEGKCLCYLLGSSPGGSRVIRSGDGVSVLGINCLIKDIEGD